MYAQKSVHPRRFYFYTDMQVYSMNHQHELQDTFCMLPTHLLQLFSLSALALKTACRSTAFFCASHHHRLHNL